MTVPFRQQEKIHLPQGFSFSSVTAGIKASGKPDLALIETSPGTTAAALFTKNRVVAAPLVVGRASLAAMRGRVRAVVVNSGNANCATGKPGLRACEEICRRAGKALGVRPQEIFPSSTGIIGVPMPAEKIVAKLPELFAERQPTEDAFRQFSRAIMTTDTRPKVASAQFKARKTVITLTGVAKGSGMIHPQMATMLVYLFTDAVATARELKSLLTAACDQTFNSMSVDGDTSTNDTVLLLASGKSGVRLNSPRNRKQFADALLAVCSSLADQIVSDGEGVEHVVRLSVEQAKDRQEALHVARAVAHSLLVKTAWAGADPNWGRMLSAVGSCGVVLDPAKVSIFIGRQLVCRGGVGVAFDHVRAHLDLAQPRSAVRIVLKRGKASAVFTTTDLTADYVRINADYST